MFHDPADRDAGYYQFVVGDGGTSWGADPADFDRYRNYLSRMQTVTGRQNLLWQVTLCNTKTKSCNNSFWHYQDIRVEYWLDDVPHADLTAYAGAVALIWGAPQTGCTHSDDSGSDGINKPGATGATPTVTDDDGGSFRLRAAAYHSNSSGNPGPVTIPQPVHLAAGTV